MLNTLPLYHCTTVPLYVIINNLHEKELRCSIWFGIFAVVGTAFYFAMPNKCTWQLLCYAIWMTATCTLYTSDPCNFVILLGRFVVGLFIFAITSIQFSILFLAYQMLIYCIAKLNANIFHMRKMDLGQIEANRWRTEENGKKWLRNANKYSKVLK